MAHERDRFILAHIKKLLTYSPAVALFGHRQVGKTTLLNQFKNAQYFTLDDAATLDFARSSPMVFIQQALQGMMIIDECQWAPELFPAIKEYIRLHPKVGSFILSGSVRFTSRKQIRESLTGRILIQELLPFSILEAKGNSKKPIYYLDSGGLPRAMFTRNADLRSQIFSSYLDTILGRDLQLVLKTSLSTTTLRNFLTTLALTQGSPLNYAATARAARVSIPSARKLVSAFEAVFLVRVLPIKGGWGKYTVLFEDTGESSYLMRNAPVNETQALLRLIWSNLRVTAQQNYPDAHEFYQYRSRGGAEIDLVFEAKNYRCGFIFLASEEVTPKALGSARAFIQKHPLANVFFVHRQSKRQNYTTNIRLIGISEAIHLTLRSGK